MTSNRTRGGGPPEAAVPGDAAASRVSRAQGDKRALILKAAIKVFASTGYHGARVSDIAREAGIAYGLVYHYFKNKEEILDRIFDEQWSGFLEAVEAIADTKSSTEDKLLSIAALILGAYRVRSDWVKVLVFEIQRSSRFSSPDQVKAVGRLFKLVAGILRQGQKAGELRAELDPDVACFVFVGGLDIVVTSRVLNVIEIEGDAQDEVNYYLKVARTVVDLFLNGIRTGSREGVALERAGAGAMDDTRDDARESVQENAREEGDDEA